MSAKTLQDRIAFLEAAHGSLRQLARSIDVDAGYLQRLRDGKKDNPSDAGINTCVNIAAAIRALAKGGGE